MIPASRFARPAAPPAEHSLCEPVIAPVAGAASGAAPPGVGVA